MRTLTAIFSLLIISSTVSAQENVRIYGTTGKLEKASTGYLITTDDKDMPLLIAITAESGDQFGECSKGAYAFEVPEKKTSPPGTGFKLISMSCED